MVPQGKRVADVGCDHGFVSIYLVQKGISPHVLAMDVRVGPLSHAKEHIAEYGLEDYIETRLSDGLQAFHPTEAEVCICAGMGGRLMRKILCDSREKVKKLDALILQPQSELPIFRHFLRKEGYWVQDENIILEDGKYYFVMKVIPGDQEIEEDPFYDSYSRCLLEKKHPLMRSYLEEQRESMAKLKAHLTESGGERSRTRLEELDGELAELDRALTMF